MWDGVRRELILLVEMRGEYTSEEVMICGWGETRYNVIVGRSFFYIMQFRFVHNSTIVFSKSVD